ncbi:uncharacterized protein LOC119743158 isoform X2 [Patiria miniata]|uniref:Uncharacterized protein n=1 Tax=Patiria miniata TaxID=46514 RepID=A0A914BHT4_PATMI|nr:uncharacterized protein LOC119743158 isoform X2 [Patiria miniata]
MAVWRGADFPLSNSSSVGIISKLRWAFPRVELEAYNVDASKAVFFLILAVHAVLPIQAEIKPSLDPNQPQEKQAGGEDQHPYQITTFVIVVLMLVMMVIGMIGVIWFCAKTNRTGTDQHQLSPYVKFTSSDVENGDGEAETNNEEEQVPELDLPTSSQPGACIASISASVAHGTSTSNPPQNQDPYEKSATEIHTVIDGNNNTVHISSGVRYYMNSGYTTLHSDTDCG